MPVRDRLQRAVDRLMYGDPRNAELIRQRESLVVAREEERRRLRRDLHDGLGPTLAAIGMRAEAAAALLDQGPDATRPQLEALGEEVRVALADVRRLVDGLRPPALDELGLLGAIGQQAARLDDGTGRESGSATIRVECEPPSLPDLPAAVEVAAYRITVEAMTNAVRHAGARLCRVRLEASSQLTIEVTDDGRGLPSPLPSGTGLESMRERAEELGGDRRDRAAAGRRDAGPRTAAPGAGDAGMTAEPHGPDEPTRVLVADDHAAFRAGLRTLLETDGELIVVGEAGTGEEAVSAAGELHPDVVLMDVNMPGLDGVEATRRIVDAVAARRGARPDHARRRRDGVRGRPGRGAGLPAQGRPAARSCCAPSGRWRRARRSSAPASRAG